MCVTYTMVLILALSVFPTTVRGEPSADAPRVSDARPVEIIEDQKAKAFRFMIDGREVARIDAIGLQVRDNIGYGGAIADAGATRLDTPVSGARHEK